MFETSDSSLSEDERRTAPSKPPPKPPAAQAPDAKRGRGRPPTTGEYVGLAAAKQALVEAQRAELALQSEKEVVEKAQSMATARVTRLRAGPPLAGQASPDARVERANHAEGLQRQIADSLAVVAGVAKVSKGLKGTLQKALKESVASIQEASEELLTRTNSEEVALLRAANSRMEAELADLRSELRSLQAELTRPRTEAAPPAPPPNMETTMAANLDRLTLLMESRFAAMEERLRTVPSPSPAPQTRPRSQPSSPSVLGIPVAEFPPLPSRRASTETAVVRSTPPPLACPAPPPPPAATEEGWTTVNRRRTRKGKTPSTSAVPVAPPAADAAESAKPRGTRGGRRRGRGQKAQEQSSQPPPPPPPSKKTEKPKPVERRAPRLRAPKSAAVVLTLQPGAADRGVTYANLFSKAKARIKLADLGIEGGLRLKRARTGARMLLVPGADSAPQADALAEQLRLNLYPEDVRVSRPEKTVCLRVSGLDDHVHEEDVAAAIARTTGCSGRTASTKQPPKAQGAKAPVAKGGKGDPPKKGETKTSQVVARNEKLRAYLALDDLDRMMSSLSEDDEMVAPAKPPPKPPAASKAPEAKRGRGRPPTTGEYVGLADAKRALVEAQRAELQLQTEKEIVERASAMVNARVTRSQTGITLASHQASPEARVAHAEGLQRQIADSLAVVSGVAKVSKGLKGTLQKALKEAAAAIQEASEELLTRTNSEEVALLRAANSRMEAEIADLRSELRSLQAEVTRPRAPVAQPDPPPPNMETALAANLERMTLAMESRFAAMEEQLRSARLAPSPAPALSPAPQARPTSLPTSPSLLPGLSEEE
ncbi:hypothetical protein K1T71_011572 [Dendrolimus kikuchii]|uniref:Uncharacterized protein n=1 Tax=Dendrolimus kikuchii TaxID=765133 RepID=A0ACC1CPE9_9NEOP|nr:hypothetical protein K1T71_011572 [Dendrolimus kikuchii]